MQTKSSIPHIREDKPTWVEVPDAIKDQISFLLGDDIIDGEIAWGGYSPSASYIVTVKSGQRFFVKGSHPEQMSHGAKMLDQEISAYLNVPFIKEYCPNYLGSVSIGDEDDWYLGIWEFKENYLSDFSWSDKRLKTVIDHLIKLHIYNKEKPVGLFDAQETNFVSDFIAGHNGWSRIYHDLKIQKKFLSLFGEQQDQALLWLNNATPLLLDAISNITQVQSPIGVIHFDLRSDNILYNAETQDVTFIDWPNICWGPVLLDLVNFFPSIESESHYSCASLIDLYQDRSKITFQTSDILAYVSSVSGYFAINAYRSVPEKLPRLRQMQKANLTALLNWTSNLLSIAPPPKII